VKRSDVPEIGALCLEQHRGLRVRLARCMALAEELMQGEHVAHALAEEVGHLRRQFIEHNETEERMLEPLLAKSDAWGPRRVDRMFEEHKGEHAALLAAMDVSTANVAAQLADLCEELEAHMAAEERTFLSPRVLDDARRAAEQS
jgi:iron-sulfur cluster repair protein YtfE (RIC family)